MNKSALISTAFLIYAIQTQLSAAAGEYAIALTNSPCMSSSSPRDLASPRKPSPRVAQSMDESSISEYEKKLTPSDSERLRAANLRVDKMGISMIDINHLIDIDTDNYLFDPIAPYRLGYIEQQLRTSLQEKDSAFKDRFSPAQMLSLPELLTLVDHAAEGTLPDRILPYNYLQFMQVRDAKKDVTPDKLDVRSYATIAILVSAANRNLRENPTYSMIREHGRQNQFLHESNEFLDAYYAEFNRPRKGIAPVSPKKKRGSFLQGLSKRLSRHKRSSSALQP